MAWSVPGKLRSQQTYKIGRLELITYANMMPGNICYVRSLYPQEPPSEGLLTPIWSTKAWPPNVVTIKNPGKVTISRNKTYAIPFGILYSYKKIDQTRLMKVGETHCKWDTCSSSRSQGGWGSKTNSFYCLVCVCTYLFCLQASSMSFVYDIVGHTYFHCDTNLWKNIDLSYC